MSKIPYVLAILFTAGATAFAQIDLRSPGAIPTDTSRGSTQQKEASGSFGTELQTYVLSAPQFDPREGGTSWEDTTLLYYSAATDVQVGAHELFVAQVDLPAGAWIEDMRCFFYDVDGIEDASVVLWRHEYDLTASAPNASLIATVTSTGSGGYQHPSASAGEQVRYRDGDQLAFYFLIAYMPEQNPDVEFNSCRLRWRRTLSPAPATPTFDDVPTDHLFFQQIEALAASGITGGCDADSFCPSAPLTRAQMAAFLASALGLHWPN